MEKSCSFKGLSHSRPSIHKSCKKILNGLRMGKTHPKGSKSFDVSERTLRFVTFVEGDSLQFFNLKVKVSKTGDQIIPRAPVRGGFTEIY